MKSHIKYGLYKGTVTIAPSISISTSGLLLFANKIAGSPAGKINCWRPLNYLEIFTPERRKHPSRSMFSRISRLPYIGANVNVISWLSIRSGTVDKKTLLSGVAVIKPPSVTG